jgi:sodium/pantothenate symporter
MSYSNATLLLLVTYAGVMLYFALRGARRTKSMADYALGSQGFSPLVVGLSLAAGITSAATFIINPGFVALYGWSAFLAMSLIIPLALYGSLVVLTKSFRQYGASVRALTLSQWMSFRYNSKSLGVWFALLSFLLLTFIVLICVGLTKVLAPALGVSELPVLTGLVIFVFGYMMFGGANTMIYTNAIQAVLMLIVAIMMLASGGHYFDQGLSGFWQKLAAVDPALILPFNNGSPLFRDWFEVIFCNLIVGVAIVCQPHIITRSLMLKRAEDVNRYLWIAIMAETIFFMVLFTGFYARLQFPDLTVNGSVLKMDAIIPAYVLRVFPVGAGLLVILGLLSAGLSTLEGLVQSVSATITNDLLAPFIESGDHDEEQHTRLVTRLNRFVIGAMALITIGWSYYQLEYPNLSVGILAQNGVYAYFSAAFVPVLLGIYGKDVPRSAPFAASVSAIAVHFIVYYGGLTPYTQGAVRNPAVAAALAILSASIVGLSIYLLRKKSVQGQL